MATERSSRRSFLSKIFASLAGCLALRPDTALAQHDDAKCLPANPSDTEDCFVTNKRIISVEEVMAKSTAYGPDGSKTVTWHKAIVTKEIDDVGNISFAYDALV